MCGYYQYDVMMSLLTLEDLRRGDNEGDSGHQNHGEAQPGQGLRRAARVRVLHGLP